MIDKIFGGKEYRISQYFGGNLAMYERYGMLGHNGIDFACPVGTPIYATHDGIIKIKDQKDKAYGLHIRIISNKYEVVYGHLSEEFVQEGEYVKKGQMIGYSGNSGYSTGAHLHYGIRKIKGGKVQNYKNGYYGYIDPLTINMEKDKFIEWAKSANLITKDKDWHNSSPTWYELIVFANRLCKYLKETYLK